MAKEGGGGGGEKGNRRFGIGKKNACGLCSLSRSSQQLATPAGIGRSDSVANPGSGGTESADWLTLSPAATSAYQLPRRSIDQRKQNVKESRDFASGMHLPGNAPTRGLQSMPLRSRTACSTIRALQAAVFALDGCNASSLWVD